MPHQCLNCGRIIERGSREILKGCSDCGGKKFMFVDQPLQREQREDLKKKADEVRDEMLRKADPEFLKVLKERGIGNLEGSEMEMDDTLGEDWVRVKPGKSGKVEVVEGDSGSGLEMITTKKGKRSARDLISQFDKDLEHRKSTISEEPAVKETKKRSKKKKKKGKKKAPGKEEKVEAPLEGGVDVINIVEQGVYEIDVKSLLEDNPIVIQKDGSYLIHLPSIFKEGRDKNSK